MADIFECSSVADINAGSSILLNINCIMIWIVASGTKKFLPTFVGKRRERYVCMFVCKMILLDF